MCLSVCLYAVSSQGVESYVRLWMCGILDKAEGREYPSCEGPGSELLTRYSINPSCHTRRSVTSIVHSTTTARLHHAAAAAAARAVALAPDGHLRAQSRRIGDAQVSGHVGNRGNENCGTHRQRDRESLGRRESETWQIHSATGDSRLVPRRGGRFERSPPRRSPPRSPPRSCRRSCRSPRS